MCVIIWRTRRIDSSKGHFSHVCTAVLTASFTCSHFARLFHHCCFVTTIPQGDSLLTLRRMPTERGQPYCSKQRAFLHHLALRCHKQCVPRQSGRATKSEWTPALFVQCHRGSRMEYQLLVAASLALIILSDDVLMFFPTFLTRFVQRASLPAHTKAL